MKACPQCQKEYPDQSTFCGLDGTSLVAQSLVVTAAPAESVPASVSPLHYSEVGGSVPTNIPLSPPVNGFMEKPQVQANGHLSPSDSKVESTARAVENPPNVPVKCRKCRKSMDADDPFCPSCGTPVAIAQAACPQCGQLHPANQRFCPKTGQSLHTNALQGKNNLPLYAALGGLAVVILIAGIFFAIQHLHSSTAASSQSSNATTGNISTHSANPLIPSVLPQVAPLSGNTMHPSVSSPVKATLVSAATPTITTFTDGIASASSFEPPHVAQYAFDGNTNTIWHTEEYQNAWISIRYPVQRHVTQIGIIAGSLKQFQESARIKEIRLRFSNGGSQILQFDDTNQMQVRKLSQPVLTDSLKFEIVGLYPGKTMHLIVPEIVVRGYGQ